MRRVATRAVAALIMIFGVGLAGSGPAQAVLAGQFCPDASAGVVVAADNGATVECLFNPNSNRNVATTAPPTTVAPVPSQTRIIAITPAPAVVVVPAPTPAAAAVPAAPVVAPLALTG